MNQNEKAELFKSYHSNETPLILYNVWDAGSAKAVEKAGAKAVATGSASVAAAHGYDDGECIPLPFLLQIAERIVRTVSCPVSVDFEGGYAERPDALKENLALLMKTGVVGINFEDRVVKGSGLYSVEAQSVRIAALREAADAIGVPLFINARTDLFLAEPDDSKHASLLNEAIMRAHAYKSAGASGFFVPWLIDLKLIAAICEATDLPVNAYMRQDGPAIEEFSNTDVSRISFGPTPYRDSMRALTKRAELHLRSSEPIEI